MYCPESRIVTRILNYEAAIFIFTALALSGYTRILIPLDISRNAGTICFFVLGSVAARTSSSWCFNRLLDIRCSRAYACFRFHPVLLSNQKRIFRVPHFQLEQKKIAPPPSESRYIPGVSIRFGADEKSRYCKLARVRTIG